MKKPIIVYCFLLFTIWQHNTVNAIFFKSKKPTSQQHMATNAKSDNNSWHEEAQELSVQTNTKLNTVNKMCKTYLNSKKSFFSRNTNFPRIQNSISNSLNGVRNYLNQIHNKLYSNPKSDRLIANPESKDPKEMPKQEWLELQKSALNAELENLETSCKITRKTLHKK